MNGNHKYEVSQDTIRSAHGCLKNFDCLEGNADLCHVEKEVNGEVLFIKNDGKNICNYRISFGDSFICCCPVRKELHKRYRI